MDTITPSSHWDPYDENFDINQIESFDHLHQYTLYSRVINNVVISEVKYKREISTSTLIPEHLSKLFRIPLKVANQKIYVTTCISLRKKEERLSRRFRTDT